VTRRRLAVLWGVVLGVVAVTLSIGVVAGGGPRTDEERTRDLAVEFACPQCAGQSVAESTTPAAVNVRQEIARLVDAGATDAEVRARITDRFGDDVLLAPSGRGVVALVWVVPVAVALISVAALGIVLWRWRSPLGDGDPDDADVDLVASFLAERAEATEDL
jgi:cytochrome c-type biogenesis protein CcmH